MHSPTSFGKPRHVRFEPRLRQSRRRRLSTRRIWRGRLSRRRVWRRRLSRRRIWRGGAAVFTVEAVVDDAAQGRAFADVWINRQPHFGRGCNERFDLGAIRDAPSRSESSPCVGGAPHLTTALAFAKEQYAAWRRDALSPPQERDEKAGSCRSRPQRRRHYLVRRRLRRRRDARQIASASRARAVKMHGFTVDLDHRRYLAGRVRLRVRQDGRVIAHAAPSEILARVSARTARFSRSPCRK